MMREGVTLQKKYFDLSDKIVAHLKDTKKLSGSKLTIAIGGESGSGKSTTANCLKILLNKYGVATDILQMDGYFKLPPKENHNKRKNDISWVGLQEVNLAQLQNHISEFKKNKAAVEIPIVDYDTNTLQIDSLDFSELKVLIVEGVYSFFMKEIDLNIFMERTFHNTLEARSARTREVYDPFVEEVLAIEHRIVASCIDDAHLLITNDYDLRVIKNI